jgi:hypothetical protein
VRAGNSEEAKRLARISSFPLQDVLGTFERADVKGVRPSGIDIDAELRSVRLDVEFDGLEALLDYVDALNAGGGPASWSLRRAQPGTGGKAGTASIEATLHGDAEEQSQQGVSAPSVR